VARRMGVPLRRLILATNENDVLDEFFRTGKYRVRKAVTATSLLTAEKISAAMTA